MTPSSPIVILPEEELFLQLSRAALLARKVAEQTLAPFGISVAEYHALRILQNTPGIPSFLMKKRLFSTAASVTQLTFGLERKKLMTRTRDKYDGRMQHLTLTAKGEETVTKAAAALTGIAGLSPDMLESSVESLTSLISSLSPLTYGT